MPEFSFPACATPTVRKDGSIQHAANYTKVRQVSSQLVFERPTVDARDMVASGSYTQVVDGSLSVRQRLGAMDRPTLFALAATGTPAVGVGGTPAFSDDDIRELLLPFIESGRVPLAP